jgi:hypothetical protein
MSLEDTATEDSATSRTVPSGWITQPVASTKGFWKAMALFSTTDTNAISLITREDAIAFVS